MASPTQSSRLAQRAIGDRPAGRHQPLADILAVDGTRRNTPAVGASVKLVACDGLATDLLGQSVGCILAAAPALAVQATGLVSLRRVDTMQAYPLAFDFEGIAVDYPCRPCDVG